MRRAILAVSVLLLACPKSKPPAAPPPATEPAIDPMSEAGLQQWLDGFVGEYKVLFKAANTAAYTASASGKEEDYAGKATAELAVAQKLSEKAPFEYLKKLREAGVVKDPTLARQLDVAYLAFLGKQGDPALLEKMVGLSNAIEKDYNTYRAKIADKEYDDNAVEAVLRTSKDQNLRRAVWEAHKGIGPVVAPRIIELVKMRNQAAKALGFSSFYAYQLATLELDEVELFKLADEVAALTDAPFAQLKGEIDAALLKKYGLKNAKDLRPWHYEDRFFQEAPVAGMVDLDPVYAKIKPIDLAVEFYASIGLDAKPIVDRSDVEPRPGKYQHAFCSDIDREGDIRIMESVTGTVRWMDTTLHELGHGVYAMGHARPDLPWLLRDAAHGLTTEGIAIGMGMLASNPYWMKRFVGLGDAEVAKLLKPLARRHRAEALIFARWALVMMSFERALYTDPDQDLNALWWQLVAKYQLVTPPDARNAPDWAAKIHLALYPVYYQNYLLGHLYAAQLHRAIAEAIFSGQPPEQVIYADFPAVGDYLKTKVFSPGLSVPWPKFVEESTGAPLSAKAFAAAYAEVPK